MRGHPSEAPRLLVSNRVCDPAFRGEVANPIFKSTQKLSMRAEFSHKSRKRRRHGCVAVALRSVASPMPVRRAKPSARICQWERWRSTECRGYLVGASPMRRQQGAKGDQRRIGALLRDCCCGAHVRSSGLKHTPRCQELLPLLVPLGSPGGRVAAAPASQLSTVHPAAWSAGRAIS